MERQRSFNPFITSWCMLIAVLALPFCTLPAQSTQTSQVLSASDVSRRLTEATARRRAALQQYESRRTMTVTYDGPLGQGQAIETVQMAYTAPATKQFTVLSATGSTLIRDNVFQRALDAEKTATTEQAQQASALNTENYNLQIKGVEQLPAGRCYVLDVAPKAPGRIHLQRQGVGAGGRLRDRAHPGAPFDEPVATRFRGRVYDRLPED